MQRRALSRTATIPITLTSMLVLAVIAAATWISLAASWPTSVIAAEPVELPAGVSIKDMPPAEDSDDLEHMVTNPIGAASDGPDRSGEYPIKPDAIQDPVEAWLSDQTSAYADDVGTGDGADLHIGWAPILQAGAYLGIDLSSTVELGEAGSGKDDSASATTTHHTLYADIDGDQAWAAPDLFDDGAHARLASLIRQAGNQSEMAAEPHPNADDAREQAEEAVAAAQFRPDGLYVPMPARALVLDQDAAASLLTDTGESILAAAHEGADFVGIPEPSEETHTSPGVVEFPQQGVDCDQARCIALTFDDGPGKDTPRLLDILEDHQVPATFFVLGSQVQQYPDVVADIYQRGHVLGNHTWDHPDLGTLDRSEIDDQITSTADAVDKLDVPRPSLIRPPYGSVSDDVRESISDAGDVGVLWDVDTLDWKTGDTDKTIDAAVSNAHAGGIILMHDIHPTTVDAVDEIITKLLHEGYTLVTVPELFGGSMNVGTMYGHGS